MEYIKSLLEVEIRMESLLNRGVAGSLTLLSGVTGRETPCKVVCTLQKVMVGPVSQ